MSICTRNCRGIGYAETLVVLYLHWILHHHSAEVFCLFECKASVVSFIWYLRCLNLSLVVGDDVVGHSGGITRLECLFSSSNVVFFRMHEEGGDCRYLY